MTADLASTPTPGAEQFDGRAAVSHGVRWGMIDQAVQVVVRLGATVLLARLVAPEAFGLIGLALVVVNLALVLSGLGLGPALVQKRDLTPRHVRTAFTTSAVFGVVLGGLVSLSAVPAAAFFHAPQLHKLLPLLGTTFVFRGVELTPNDMLTRSLRFLSYYLSSTIATAAACAIGVGLGIAGAGVWALAGMMVAESLLAAALAWVFAMAEKVWRPAVGFDRRAFRDLIGFSAFVTGSKLVAYGQGNGDNLVIGRVLGTTALGYYALAYRIMLLPLQRFGEVVSASAFPTLAAVQHDLEKVRRGFIDATRYVSAVCFPLTIGIAVTAPIAVPLLFGDKWEPAVRTLQILALAGPILSVNRLTGILAQAIGKANWWFWLSFTALVIYVPAFLIGVQFDIEGVAVAFLAATAAMIPPELRIASRALRLPWWSVLKPVWPVAFATAVMAAAALLVQAAIPSSAGDAVRLAAAVVAGAGSYGLALWWTAPDLVAEGRRMVFRG